MGLGACGGGIGLLCGDGLAIFFLPIFQNIMYHWYHNKIFLNHREIQSSQIEFLPLKFFLFSIWLPRHRTEKQAYKIITFYALIFPIFTQIKPLNT